MKLNYKPLGKYIQPFDIRNSELLDLPLMGLSVSKRFMPTIANLVGTDMKTYKIVYRNQFTYIADTSRPARILKNSPARWAGVAKPEWA